MSTVVYISPTHIDSTEGSRPRCSHQLHTAPSNLPPQPCPNMPAQDPAAPATHTGTSLSSPGHPQQDTHQNAPDYTPSDPRHLINSTQTGTTQHVIDEPHDNYKPKTNHTYKKNKREESKYNIEESHHTQGETAREEERIRKEQ